MNRQIVAENVQNPFDQIKHVDALGNEYWSAREFGTLLKYVNWRDVDELIERAKISCLTHKIDEKLHFAPESKSSPMPNGGVRQVKDYRLTRYACYLVAMNGDVRKKEIAAAQSYFAIQTVFAENVQSGNVKIPQSLPEVLRAAADAIEAKEKLEQQLAIAQPKADIYDDFLKSNQKHSGYAVAKFFHQKLGLGNGGIQKFYKLLRTDKILFKTAKGENLPYQNFMNQHKDFFEIRPEFIPNGQKRMITYFSPLFILWYIKQKNLTLQQATNHP